MNFLSPLAASGHKIDLVRTDPRHYTQGGIQGPLGPAGPKGFEDMMFEALHGVNNLQQEAGNISQEMILNPDSVDAHDVTIALAKANLSLSITKGVMDRAIRAYREIISIR